jgi:hypothetical protein
MCGLSHICNPDVPRDATTLHGSDLKPHAEVWAKILSHNVYMKAGNYSVIPAMVASFTHAVEIGQSGGMGHFIAMRMHNLPNSRRHLPYGRLLNRLWFHLDLVLNNPTIPKSKPIDKVTLKRMSNLPGSKRPRKVDSENSTDLEDSPHQTPQGESSGANLDRPITYGEYLDLSKKVEKNHSLLKNIFRFLKKAFPDCSSSPPRD